MKSFCLVVGLALMASSTVAAAQENKITQIMQGLEASYEKCLVDNTVALGASNKEEVSLIWEAARAQCDQTRSLLKVSDVLRSRRVRGSRA